MRFATRHLSTACILVLVLCSGCKDNHNSNTRDHEPPTTGRTDLLYGSHFEGPQASDRVIIFVHGIFATPMYGSFVANFAHVWNEDPMLRDLFKGDGSQFTATLAQSWRAGKFNSIHRFCAYEKQPTPDRAGVIVVTEESATYLCDSAIPTHGVPDSNHISIVKPLNITSYPHVLLREAVLSIWPAQTQIAEGTPGAVAGAPGIPSETRVTKSICELYGEAPSGAPAWNKFETCVIPDMRHLDTDYRQTDFICCGGGASSPMSARDVPPGLEIRTDGGYYWSVPEIHLSNDQITLKTYCGPGASGQPGCNVKVKVLGHYRY